MRKLILIFIVFICAKIVGQDLTQVTFSEIMFNAPDNSEFIELYNISDNQIDLSSFKIQYLSYQDNIIDAGFGTVIGPKTFAVIFEGDYDFENGIYKNLIPSGALIVKISDNSFGSGGMANSSDRDLILINNSDTIDVYTYSANNEKNYSDEKVNLILSNSRENWSNSKLEYGTPGKQNSVSPKAYDLKIIDFYPILNQNENEISFEVAVENLGLNHAEFNISILIDYNLDSLSDELVWESQKIFLQSNDSIYIKTPIIIDELNKPRGIHIHLIYSLDENTTNNRLFKIIFPPYNYNDLVINEILFRPENGEPEWIELFNKSIDTAYIHNFIISDFYTTQTSINIDENLIIPPNGYFVLTKEQSITLYHDLDPGKFFQLDLPVLNNDKDAVILLDSYRIMIDSVLYNSDFENKPGYSIERINADLNSNDPLNWGISTDTEQSTPTRINSLTQKDYDLIITEIFTIPKFPVRNSSFKFGVKILNKGKLSAENFTVILSYRDTANNTFSTIESSNFNFLNANDSIEFIAHNQILLDSDIELKAEVLFDNDENYSNNILNKIISPSSEFNSIIITEIMNNPSTGFPEWVEIFNNSPNKINLKNWTISDLSSLNSLTQISNNDIILNQKEYIVITNSSENIYFEDSVRYFISDFNSLGNSEDAIMIYDANGKMIDSIHYNSDWDILKGHSIEKINYNTQNIKSNWNISFTEKGTPGRPNTNIFAEHIPNKNLVINEILFEPAANNAEFIELYNTSDDTINLAGINFYVSNKFSFSINSIEYKLPPESYFVVADDSSIINYYNKNDTEMLYVSNYNFDLKNSGDVISVKDFFSNPIDSIEYNDSWHNQNILSYSNKSLEKVNPLLNSNDKFNWSTSVSPEGATPLSLNSIYQEQNLSIQNNISVSPNPFSPDNDGFEDFGIINYNLTNPVSQLRLRIFDSKGRVVRTLENNSPSGSSGSITFDGKDENGNPLRVGIYIILLEAVDANTFTEEKLKTVFVIARKL